MKTPCTEEPMGGPIFYRFGVVGQGRWATMFGLPMIGSRRREYATIPFSLRQQKMTQGAHDLPLKAGFL